MVPGAPIQSTPMNQSAMATPIATRWVNDEPNKATNVATTTVEPAVIPTVERRSNVIFFDFWLVVFVVENHASACCSVLPAIPKRSAPWLAIQPASSIAERGVGGAGCSCVLS
jgi:hypothetical protein